MAYNIFIADSSLTTHKIVEMELISPEFVLFSCPTREELLKRLGEVKPDVVILNLSLPDGDGYELAAHLNSQPDLGKVPLILLQNAFEPADEKRLASLVFLELISKPFESGRLALAVKKAVGQPEEPDSFPEELEIPATVLAGQEDLLTEPSKDLMALVQQTVRKEIVSLERELEKRLQATLRNELQAWLEEKWRQLLKEREQDE
mgnify:CR=1 FL=1